MSFTIALAGNPNSGKTTLFNRLTGMTQRVGNWPGVTVEKKEGTLKDHPEVIIQDLPGIYSLSPYSAEEIIARNYLVGEKPQVIINVVDASNLERNLYLTTQLLETGIPVVIALNMIDIVKKNGDTIDIKKLGETLGCAVVETSALKSIGLTELTKRAVGLASTKATPSPVFSSAVEDLLSKIGRLIEGKMGTLPSRWAVIKLFERDEAAVDQILPDSASAEQIEALIADYEQRVGDDAESIIVGERYQFIGKLVKSCVTIHNTARLSTSDRIDQIVTNRFLALPIFALVMFLVYYLSISTVGAFMTDWVNESLFGETIPEAVGGFLESLAVSDWLNGLILDGIVAGVGAVLGFVPQMAVLFLCLAILEDCGYMARIAFILDRVFRKFGLSGKSFIPMLISTGCGVPGIMASRTIENDADRRMTVMTTIFIPCAAKLPIIALISGALFPESAWVAPSTYFLGIGAVIVSGIMLKKTRLFAGEVSPFVMELPAYHLPGLAVVLRTIFDRCMAFIKKAGTIVLLATVSVWFLSSFNWSLEMVDANESILAGIGGAIAPVFEPLGWGNWRATVATITGLIAKENVVGTFGVLYGFAEVSEDGAEYWPQLVAAYTPLAAYSFLAFNLLCAPCFAAIGALRREMMSAKWTCFAIAYQCVFAYAAALIIYQTGLLVQGHAFGLGSAFALICALTIAFFLFRKPYSNPISRQDLRWQKATG